MHLDSNGLVILDQEAFPGNIGDSCCYTSNIVTMQVLLGQVPAKQTETILTSGTSLTYNVPNGATYLRVRMVGGGGIIIITAYF